MADENNTTLATDGLIPTVAKRRNILSAWRRL